MLETLESQDAGPATLDLLPQPRLLVVLVPAPLAKEPSIALRTPKWPLVLTKAKIDGALTGDQEAKGPERAATNWLASVAYCPLLWSSISRLRLRTKRFKLSACHEDHTRTDPDAARPVCCDPEARRHLATPARAA